MPTHLCNAIFLTSAITGVEKGIKFLSNTNMIVASLLAIAVFLLGPMVAIIDTFTNTLAAMPAGSSG